MNIEKRSGKRRTDKEIDLKLVKDYLQNTRGLDLSGYRPDIVERSITKRQTVTEKSGCRGYLEFLKKCPAEIDILLDHMIINVSRFFRNTLCFDFFVEFVLPEIISKKIKEKNNFLRIWSAGCSTGEEPYSISILLNELFERERPDLKYMIFATDIDKGALKKARKGVYSFESVKDVKHGLIKKYFKSKGDSYILNPVVKESVNFSYYDLLDRKILTPPESVFGDFDILFCRNVLIYFQLEYQEEIFRKLQNALVKGGYIVLGSVEAPPLKYSGGFKKEGGLFPVYQKK